MVNTDKRKGFTAVAIVLIAVIVLAAAGGIWYYEAQQSISSQQTAPVQNATTTLPIQATTTSTSSTSQVPQSTIGVSTSSEYGLILRIPPGATSSSNEDNSNYYNNFIDQSGVVFLGGIDAPSVRGTFTASVSMAIKNKATCDQFGEFAYNSMSSSTTITVDGINYINVGRGGAAAGTESDAETFHTYQNGFCYEFIFTTFSFGGSDANNPSAAGVENMQNALLKGISFSVPTASPPKGTFAPRVTSFTATPQTEGGTNIPMADDFIFSWTTQGVDYVQLSYPCPNYLASSYDSGKPACTGYGNIPLPPSSTMTQYSPNGSTTILFDYQNWNEDQTSSSLILPPIPLTLTLGPFVNGVGYPNLNKTITITVTQF